MVCVTCAAREKGDSGVCYLCSEGDGGLGLCHLSLLRLSARGGRGHNRQHGTDDGGEEALLEQAL